jgi:chorismate mutase
MTLYLRGVRGATTVDENSSSAILKGTRELLALMIRSNGIDPSDVCSAFFTTTRDLDAEFPALAARQLNWMSVPLMCGNEMPVSGALQKCVRVLVHWNTTKEQNEIIHVYIRDAVRLRPDILSLPPVDWNELNTWIDENINETIRSSR